MIFSGSQNTDPNRNSYNFPNIVVCDPFKHLCDFGRVSVDRSPRRPAPSGAGERECDPEGWGQCGQISVDAFRASQLEHRSYRSRNVFLSVEFLLGINTSITYDISPSRSIIRQVRRKRKISYVKRKRFVLLIVCVSRARRLPRVRGDAGPGRAVRFPRYELISPERSERVVVAFTRRESVTTRGRKTGAREIRGFRPLSCFPESVKTGVGKGGRGKMRISPHPPLPHPIRPISSTIRYRRCRCPAVASHAPCASVSAERLRGRPAVGWKMGKKVGKFRGKYAIAYRK